MPLDSQNFEQYRGATLIDANGDSIGKISEIYLDDRTGQPEWALVNTGLFGTRSSFVPLRDASPSGDDLRVNHDKSTVKDAPNVDDDGHLSEEEERELYAYYGMDYDTDYDRESYFARDDATVEPSYAGQSAGYRETETVGGTDYDRGADYDRTVAADVSGAETDDAMTVSEEQLHVGTERRETGRARLRKYVVTENVTKTVPVSREEVRIEREPITDANVGDAMSGPALSEEEAEVTLTEERPVVEKDVVPTERVRMETDTVTDEEQISEDVRREEVEVDEDVRRDGPDVGRRRDNY